LASKTGYLEDSPAFDQHEGAQDFTDALVDGMERTENREALRRALNKLPDDERRIVDILFLKPMKLKDISQTLGVSNSTVCKKREKALNKLKKLMTTNE